MELIKSENTNNESTKEIKIQLEINKEKREIIRGKEKMEKLECKRKMNEEQKKRKKNVMTCRK